MEHARQREVGGVATTTGHHIASVDDRGWRAGQPPPVGRREGRVAGHLLDPSHPGDELRVGGGPGAVRRGHAGVGDGQVREVDLPRLGGHAEKRLPGRGRRGPHVGNHLRRGHAPEGAHVVRDEVGVAEQGAHRGGRGAQLLGREADQLRAAPLPHLDLARCDRVASIGPHVQPGAPVVARHDQEPVAEPIEERVVVPRQVPWRPGRLAQLHLGRVEVRRRRGDGSRFESPSGGVPNRGHDPRIRAAAADVVVEGGSDLVVGRVAISVQQSRYRHHHAQVCSTRTGRLAPPRMLAGPGGASRRSPAPRRS